MMGTWDQDRTGCSLGHLLSAWDSWLGLKSKPITGHLLASSATSATERLLELIDGGGRRLAQFVDEARS